MIDGDRQRIAINECLWAATTHDGTLSWTKSFAINHISSDATQKHVNQHIVHNLVYQYFCTRLWRKFQIYQTCRRGRLDQIHWKSPKQLEFDCLFLCLFVLTVYLFVCLPLSWTNPHTHTYLYTQCFYICTFVFIYFRLCVSVRSRKEDR